MKSYLKFLSRNKLYTAIEFVGLAVSLAFVILIGSYVTQQYGVAHENPDWKRLYALGTEDYIALCYWDKEEIEAALPEVEVAARIAPLWDPVMEIDGVSLHGCGIETDPQFFDLFPYYGWVEGSVDAFRSKDAALVSESFARKIAKDGEGILGKTIKIDRNVFRIVGILKDFDHKYVPYSDIVINCESNYWASKPKSFNSIGSHTTFYRIAKGASREDVDAKVMETIKKDYGPIWGTAIEGWRTYRFDEAFFSGKGNGWIRQGNIRMLRLLTLVVLLLLLSAVFNYINLSFALSGKRAKEMATRRLLGAGKGNIAWKYVSESVLFTAVSFAAALLLAYSLVPTMNSLLFTGSNGEMVTDVLIRFMVTPGYIAAYIAGTFILGALCGLMPAWMASRYEPIDVIKGTLRRKGRMVFSKVFIVAQNALAVMLIALAIVMETQMKHMKDRPMNSEVDNRYYIEYSAANLDQMRTLKDKVEQLPFVRRVGIGRGLPGIINMTFGVKVSDEKSVSIATIICDSVYFNLLGLRVQEEFNHPLTHSVWLSRSAFVESEVSDTSASFSRRFNINGATAEYIGGVVEDFPTGSASEAETNLNGGVIVTRPEETSYAHCLLIETTGEDKEYDGRIIGAYEEYSLEKFGVIRPAWKHGFVKDLHDRQLEPERRTLRLLDLFMFLSVLIALLGLLAMSTYYSDENTRQIAVRKVFGGDVAGETWRNVKSYMLMVLVACIIGIPVAVWLSGKYLARFAYRIEGYGWIFIVAVAIAAAAAFSSVLWQTIRAARTNPANELRKE